MLQALLPAGPGASSCHAAAAPPPRSSQWPAASRPALQQPESEGSAARSAGQCLPCSNLQLVAGQQQAFAMRATPMCSRPAALHCSAAPQPSHPPFCRSAILALATSCLISAASMSCGEAPVRSSASVTQQPLRPLGGHLLSAHIWDEDATEARAHCTSQQLISCPPAALTRRFLPSSSSMVTGRNSSRISLVACTSSAGTGKQQPTGA